MPLRNVTSWEELNVSLREIFSLLDLLRTTNLDFHQRQIKNAHPSIDDYDYVVRKELKSLSQTLISGLTKKGSSGANFEVITFGIGVGSSVLVANDVTPPRIWSNSKTGIPMYAAIAANTPPTGSDVIVDILKNGTSILDTTKFHLPVGTAAKTVVPVTARISSGVTLVRPNVITANVTQVGSATPGKDITVVIFCKVS